MRKVLLLAAKDIQLAFRDRAAILLMLAAPFALTLGLALVSGRFNPTGSSFSLRDIPVLILNEDNDQLGNALVDVLQSDELSELLEPTIVTDLEKARKAIDDDQAAALVVIPAGFTRSIIPQAGTNTWNTPAAPLELYANPARPTSSGVVEAILSEFLSRVEEARLAGMTTVMQMLKSGRISPSEMYAEGSRVGERLATTSLLDEAPIALRIAGDEEAQTREFDIMAYMAPGMALLFLMFTATYGGRSFLAERRQRTLHRLLTTPTSLTQVFAGKLLGIFFTGVLQLLILVGGSSLLFRLQWGNWLGVLALILCSTFAATGWGLLLTSIARTPEQVATFGSALMLIFGILGGSFIDLQMLPGFVRIISRITPNSWGLDGFTILATGGGISDLVQPLLGLMIMGGILFIVAVSLFARRRSTWIQ